MIQDMGNTFLEESNDLLVLYTKYIMEAVGGNVRKGETIHCPGSIQQVCQWRLSTFVMPVTDPLSRNKLPVSGDVE